MPPKKVAKKKVAKKAKIAPARVDWAALRMLDGKEGKRIQVVMRDLSKEGDKASFAKGKIFAAIVGQRPATVDDIRTCSAAPPTLSALIRLAGDPVYPERHRLLALAHELLRFGYTLRTDDLDRGFDRGRSPWREAYDTTLGAAVYGAARDSLPALIALLDDADPQVRANATAILGSLADCAAELAPILSARIEVEKSPAAGASNVIALYYLARFAEGTSHAATTKSVILAALERAITPATQAEHPLVRGLALVVTTLLRPTPGSLTVPVGVDASAMLREMLLGLVPYGTLPGYANLLEPSTVFGWEFNVEFWALHLLGDERLGLRPFLTEVLIDTARALEAVSCGLLAGHAVRFVLFWHLRARDQELGLVSASDLSQTQLALVTRLSEIDTQGPFAEYGLSPEARSRRRQLGIDPAGPLERVVVMPALTGASGWPIWRIVFELLITREQGWSAVRAAITAAAPDLTPRDWLDIWFECFAYKGKGGGNMGPIHYAYGVLWMYSQDALPELLASLGDDGRIAWATFWHARLRRWPTLLGVASCLILGELVVRRLGPTSELPEEFDQDVCPGFGMPLREVCERIPAPRLTRLIERLVKANEMSVTTASTLVDLAPDALTVLYEDLERRKGGEYVRASEGRVMNDDGEFLALLKRDPRVRSVHDAYMKRPPLPDQPKVARRDMTLWP